MRHEDDRRVLESYPEAKIVTAKKDCVIGNHYHMKKTELFILSSGECTVTKTTETKTSFHNMQIGRIYEVAPGTNHEFRMKEGSVLIGINSHVHDDNDDYK